MVPVHGLMDPVPSDSIYFWMYRQGLKRVPINDVYWALRQAGKEIRKKDEENYWNGWYNSTLYSGAGQVSVFNKTIDRRRSRPTGMSSPNLRSPTYLRWRTVGCRAMQTTSPSSSGDPTDA